ncbi:alpha/beta fold hydrolase [Nocardia sp. NPDC051570]|uniref:alpha/beta fold hydrolase n=1 Tax=Nocardia sp. NPDC051570 TaxID=3364324 RepID=UPI0037B65798
MTGWHSIERGTGRPLILLHGGGASARSWLPVLDRLGAERHAIALDFPGFGETPDPEVEITIDWVLDELTEELRRREIPTPVDIVGNSMGGLFALEFAKRGLARSVVALAPVTLWRSTMPLPLRAQFQLGMALAPVTRTPVRRILDKPAVRRALLSIPFAHPEHMTGAEAIAFMQDLDRSRPTLHIALNIAKSIRFQGGNAITCPITVAFGTRDHMLPPSTSQVHDELPAQTRWLTLPDCGHMPMWDNPALIAETILTGTESDRLAQTG